ncbi:annexin D3-like [Euphorbia lathyris]|uniref:annexin D3-like n=1 Tax=Euphorbia lathyris TaxID=212925 RepID=UPI0033139FFD
MSTLKIPDVVPSPTQDAERLRKAFQGLGTDEAAVIWVLGHRNVSQRKKIREIYQQLYKESLLDRLKSELSGDFEKAVILWTQDPSERDARLANKALKAKKISTKQLRVIVEIACATPPTYLQEVRSTYCSLFDSSIEEHIASAVSSPLRKLLVGLVSSFRFNKEVVDPYLAMEEAEKLHEAIKTKKLDDDDLVFVLSTRSLYQIRATFESYKQKFGSSIDQDLTSCGDGDLQSLLKVVVLSIESPTKYFAEVIRKSIIGIGTDEDALTRTIVARSEIDMIDIKEEYLNTFKTSIEQAVTGDTSGDYQSFLMTLLGAKM